jgi:hypothetical protein
LEKKDFLDAEKLLFLTLEFRRKSFPKEVEQAEKKFRPLFFLKKFLIQLTCSSTLFFAPYRRLIIFAGFFLSFFLVDAATQKHFFHFVFVPSEGINGPGACVRHNGHAGHRNTLFSQINNNGSLPNDCASCHFADSRPRGRKKNAALE